jgi:hypothetical protein
MLLPMHRSLRSACAEKKSWFNSLANWLRPRRPMPIRKPRRLRLESLEGRSLLATITAVDDDMYSVNEDEPFVAAVSVLSNDYTDYGNDPLSAVIVEEPLHGTLDFSPDGTFSYTPDPHYYGNDTFQYEATDGSVTSNVATVTISVIYLNDTPVAGQEDYELDEDGALNISAPGVLANDSDVETVNLIANLVSPPAQGTFDLFSDGSFTYTPPADFHGIDSFAYQAFDGENWSDTIVVTLTVNSVNDAPVGSDDEYTISENGELEISAAGVLSNDFDADDAFWVSFAESAEHGVVSVESDGSLSYTPDVDFFGLDSFDYWLTDGGTSSIAPATVFITVVGTPRVDLDTDSDNSGAIESTAAEEADEYQNPGKVFAANVDDDNSNGIQDRYDVSPFVTPTGVSVLDNDLVPANISIDARGRDLTGFRLEFAIYSGITVWSSPDKQQLMTWLEIGTDAIPSTVWVEGVSSSQPTLELVLRDANFVEFHRDVVKFTVVSLDAIAYRPQTAPFQAWQVPFVEETTGVGIRRNGDDDDNNGIRDGDESPLLGVPGENDLIRVDLQGFESPTVAHGVAFKVKRADLAINVWHDDAKLGELLSPANGLLEAVVDPLGVVFVEWPEVAGGSSILTLSVWDTLHNREVYADAIVFTPFTSIVLVLGGEGQVPDDPPVAPLNQGIFTLAIQEYRESGLDVYVYDEDAVDLDGSGPVYDEVVSAIQERGVTDVAIMGYSHGGGSTYGLSWRLSRNTVVGSGVSDITNAFSIVFTGYIDAIDDGGPSPGAETRRPLLSQFHCAQYEQNNVLGFLNGAPSGGDDDMDRSYLGVTHTTIDDNTIVLSWLRTRLRQKVSL